MLEGRTIIVTGAARGLGRVMALALAGQGAIVAGIDLPSAAAELNALAPEGVRGFEADITDAAQVAATLTRIEETCGQIFGLVNNAGRGPAEAGRKRFHEMDVAHWRAITEVNITGGFIMAHAVAPRLMAAGRGRIVNVTTSYQTMQAECFSPYGPSKAAMEAATVIWAKDLAGTGVTVNALLPGGAADTRMIPVSDVPDRASLVQPAVMRAPIMWLMSDAADGVTGQRFIGRNWDPSLPPDEAARHAGAPAGFPA